MKSSSDGCLSKRYSKASRNFSFELERMCNAIVIIPWL